MATCVKQLKMSQITPWEKEFRASGPVNKYGVLQVKEKPVCPEISIKASDEDAYIRERCLKELAAWERK